MGTVSYLVSLQTDFKQSFLSLQFKEDLVNLALEKASWVGLGRINHGAWFRRAT